MSGFGRLMGLTGVAMAAFAANSVLTRMAVGPGFMDPISFAVVRLVAGALMLGAVLALRAVVAAHGDGRSKVWPGWGGRVVGVAGLLVYLFGFSWAYLSLEAGVGALILFGAVQVTMFAGAVVARDRVPGRAWAGAALAFGGLLVLVAPGFGAGAGDTPALAGAVAMGLAGVGWGFYSLAGRGAVDALGATAWNFILAVPIAGLVVLGMGGLPGPVTGWGLVLAGVSGAVTSGLGYALWYGVVPALGAARAGVAQLTVPLMAAAAGALVMDEGVGLRFVLASVLVLGGVTLASGSGRGKTGGARD